MARGIPLNESDLAAAEKELESLKKRADTYQRKSAIENAEKQAKQIEKRIKTIKASLNKQSNNTVSGIRKANINKATGGGSGFTGKYVDEGKKILDAGERKIRIDAATTSKKPYQPQTWEGARTRFKRKLLQNLGQNVTRPFRQSPVGVALAEAAPALKGATKFVGKRVLPAYGIYEGYKGVTQGIQDFQDIVGKENLTLPGVQSRGSYQQQAKFARTLRRQKMMEQAKLQQRKAQQALSFKGRLPQTGFNPSSNDINRGITKPGFARATIAPPTPKQNVNDVAAAAKVQSDNKLRQDQQRRVKNVKQQMREQQKSTKEPPTQALAKEQNQYNNTQKAQERFDNMYGPRGMTQGVPTAQERKPIDDEHRRKGLREALLRKLNGK